MRECSLKNVTGWLAMELADEALTAADYAAVLVEYLRERSEQALLRASDLSRMFVEGGLGPEDVVALHFESLQSVLHEFGYRDQTRAIGDAHHFLLETMITYGVYYSSLWFRRHCPRGSRSFVASYSRARRGESRYHAELKLIDSRSAASSRPGVLLGPHRRGEQGCRFEAQLR
jgi:hypothetical protein